MNKEIKSEEEVMSLALNNCSEDRARKGIEWLKELASLGQSADAVFLAEFLMTGAGGLEEDHREALKWARKAIEGGHPDGYFFLALLYFEGKGVPQNEELACENWLRAAQFGNLQSQYAVAQVLGYGDSKILSRNKVEAYKWASIAASNSQGWHTGMPDKRNLVSGRIRADALRLRDQLKSELSKEEQDRAQQLAATWKPLRWKASVMKYDIAQHEVIRKAVLGDMLPSK